MPTFEWVCVATIPIPFFVAVGMWIYDKIKNREDFRNDELDS